MCQFFFPPSFPTLLSLNSNSASVKKPICPISEILHCLLPLKTRWIEQIWSKKPRQSHKPTADSQKNVAYCTTIIITICKINNQQKHNLKPFDKMTARVEPVVLTELNMADNKPSTGCLIPCTTMENCPTKVMRSCSQRECEKDRTELELHSDEAHNGPEEALFQYETHYHWYCSKDSNLNKKLSIEGST
uniref:Uncharacterized protein n=1 Tax=Opuntia streptacantha TaxID=393608 RepID=A0A7C8ZUW7_OPUST